MIFDKKILFPKLTQRASKKNGLANLSKAARTDQNLSLFPQVMNYLEFLYTFVLLTKKTRKKWQE